MCGALLLFCGLGFLQTVCRCVTFFQYLNIKLFMTVISLLPTPVSFWLRGTTYQNNSIVTLEDIGEWSNALFCVTDLTACCKPSSTSEMGPVYTGDWYFPNGTRVPSSGMQWDIHRTRGQQMVVFHRRRGGEDGVYRCDIRDTMNVAVVTQTIYIGVYSARTGEW